MSGTFGAAPTIAALQQRRLSLGSLRQPRRALGRSFYTVDPTCISGKPQFDLGQVQRFGHFCHGHRTAGESSARASPAILDTEHPVATGDDVFELELTGCGAVERYGDPIPVSG
jgi:hypothetical protein